MELQFHLWYAGLEGTAVPSKPIYHSHLHRVTYTRRRNDTIDSPDDEHLVARKM